MLESRNCFFMERLLRVIEDFSQQTKLKRAVGYAVCGKRHVGGSVYRTVNITENTGDKLHKLL